jgi:hypothetical protein
LTIKLAKLGLSLLKAFTHLPEGFNVEDRKAKEDLENEAKGKLPVSSWWHEAELS